MFRTRYFVLILMPLFALTNCIGHSSDTSVVTPLPPTSEDSQAPDPVPEVVGSLAENEPQSGGGMLPASAPNEPEDEDEELPTTASENPHDASAEACDLNMTAGVRFDVDVAWEGGLAIEAGQGRIQLWYVAELERDGQRVSANGEVCGITIPDFQTGAIAGNERMGTEWPPGLWNNPSFPEVNLTIDLPDAEPGGAISMEPFGMLMGADMGDPVNGSWPDQGDDVRTADHDGDGKPGVTAHARGEAGYAYPRVSILNQNKRADRIYLALRNIISLDGALDSCDTASGQAQVRLDQHAVGCRLTDGSDCNGRQVSLLDRNMPQFTVNAAAFDLQRLAPGAGCDAVRAQMP